MTWDSPQKGEKCVPTSGGCYEYHECRCAGTDGICPGHDVLGFDVEKWMSGEGDPKNYMKKKTSYDIKINDWKYFTRVNKSYDKIKLFLDGEEILNFNDKYTNYFAKHFIKCRFFLFILLDEYSGLKILCDDEHKYDYYKAIELVIKIQKILHKEGVSFDCDDEVLEIDIEDIANKEKRSFYGFRTDTDICFERLEERFTHDFHSKYELLSSIFVKHRIRRYMGHHELFKPENYIFTNDNKLMFIDIDPRFRHTYGR